MTCIIITGTPGVGKTSIAKALAEIFNYTYIDVNDILKSNKDICIEYDKKRECDVVDEEKLAPILKEVAQSEDVVIDSHLSHYMDKKYVDYCVILQCDITELKKRLEARGYKEEKVRENLDVEIFDTLLTEAQELGHNILVFDTTGKKASEVAKEIANEISQDKR